jgi:hypothetical protein
MTHTSQQLGRLQLLNPRHVWTDEARHFTPWLFDNQDYLAEVLGIELELTHQEHGVGAFSLDLFGDDLTHDCPLIVENQLEDTDHRHLGQLLTYAAGTDAQTVVWVATRFRDEHRQALDFLNDMSSGAVRFFGIEIRVGIIEGSPPAPMFSLAVQPSDWRAQVRAQRATEAMSPTKAAYLKFWTEYIEQIQSTSPELTNVRSPQPHNWMTLNSVRAGITINAAFNRDGNLACELYIDSGDAAANLSVFRALHDRRDEIEADIGQALQWEELEGKQACRIKVGTPGQISDHARHPQLLAWLQSQHITFKQVFRPIVHSLDAALWHPEPEPDH